MLRTSIAFVIIHIGLILSVYGLASLSHIKEVDQNVLAFLLVGTILLYGGLLFGVFMLIWPIYSIMRKLRQFLQWRDWLVKELPQIIAVIPPLIQALREAFQPQAQNQSGHQEDANLHKKSHQ